MSKYKLAISIPTYNRPDSIDSLLANLCDFAEKLKIGIYILDGSDNNRTFDVIKKYKEKGINSIEYYLYKSDQTRKRFLDMLTLPDCEYVWPCRDRFYYKSIDYYEIILKMIELDFHVVGIRADMQVKQDFQVYNSIHAFIRDSCISMHCLGSFIIRKNIVKQLPDSLSEKTYWLTWPHLTATFYSLAFITDFKGIYFNFSEMSYSLDVSYHEWDEKNRYLQVWLADSFDFIDDLPAVYDNDKDYLKKNAMYLPVKFAELLVIRKQGILDFSTAKRFKNYLKKTSAIPYPFIIFLACIPKSFAKVAHASAKTIELVFNFVTLFSSKIKNFLSK